VRGVNNLLQLEQSPDVIILDDAFQHRHIRPGLSILLVDYSRPVFRDYLLPAGNLREPWLNSRRADFIVVSKCPATISKNDRKKYKAKLKLRKKQTLFFTTYSYGAPVYVFPEDSENNSLNFRNLRDKNTRIMLVTGIANPLPLQKYLEGKIGVHDSLIFPDHHPFSSNDLKMITRRFESIPFDEKYILVTEKDAVRLRELEIEPDIKKRLLYIPVDVDFLGKEKTFQKKIFKYLKK
jgi:tetraacyldisaccharide 4'-kinase